MLAALPPQDIGERRLGGQELQGRRQLLARGAGDASVSPGHDAAHHVARAVRDDRTAQPPGPKSRGRHDLETRGHQDRERPSRGLVLGRPGQVAELPHVDVFSEGDAPASDQDQGHGHPPLALGAQERVDRHRATVAGLQGSHEHDIPTEPLERLGRLRPGGLHPKIHTRADHLAPRTRALCDGRPGGLLLGRVENHRRAAAVGKHPMSAASGHEHAALGRQAQAVGLGPGRGREEDGHVELAPVATHVLEEPAHEGRFPFLGTRDGETPDRDSVGLGGSRVQHVLPGDGIEGGGAPDLQGVALGHQARPEIAGARSTLALGAISRKDEGEVQRPGSPPPDAPRASSPSQRFLSEVFSSWRRTTSCARWWQRCRRYWLIWA